MESVKIKKQDNILVNVRQAFMDLTVKRRPAYVPKILVKMEVLAFVILRVTFVTAPRVSQGFYVKRKT